MTQAEVYNYLKKNPNKWFITKTIARHFDKTSGAILSNLQRLVRVHRVLRKFDFSIGTPRYVWRFNSLCDMETRLERKNKVK